MRSTSTYRTKPPSGQLSATSALCSGLTFTSSNSKGELAEEFIDCFLGVLANSVVLAQLVGCDAAQQLLQRSAGRLQLLVVHHVEVLGQVAQLQGAIDKAVVEPSLLGLARNPVGSEPV